MLNHAKGAVSEIIPTLIPSLHVYGVVHIDAWIHSIFSLGNWRALHHHAAVDWLISTSHDTLPSSSYGERCYGIHLLNHADEGGMGFIVHEYNN